MSVGSLGPGRVSPPPSARGERGWLRLRRSGAARSQRGLSLLDVVLATAVVAVALLGLLGTLASSSAARTEAVESELAARASAAVIAAIEATPADGVRAAFAGKRFSVPGLAAPAGVTYTGQVTMYFDELAIPADMGGPRDLNADNGGTPDDTDASGDGAAPRYRVVPVLVSLRWRGVAGERTQALRALVRPRE